MADEVAWSVERTESPVASATFAPGDTTGAGPDVSVVLVAYGTGSVIVDCLDHLADAARSGRRTVEVTVVDNPHPEFADRTRRWLLTTTRGVRLVTPTVNLGFGGGCELGAMLSTGDILCFLNVDTEVPADLVDTMCDALTDPAASPDGPPTVLSPVLVHPDGSVQEVFHRIDDAGRGHVVTEIDASRTIVAADYASATCWFIGREHHELVGGFDPAYFPAYYDDVDVACRVRHLGGWCGVHQGVQVVHHRHAGTPNPPTTYEPQRQVFLRTWPDVVAAAPTVPSVDNPAPGG